MNARTTLIATLVVVLALIGASVYWLSLSEHDDSGTPATLSGPRTADRGDDGSLPRIPDPSDPSAVDASAPGPLDAGAELTVVEGFVRDGQGRPIPFADVSAYRFDAHDYGSPRDNLELIAQTNAEGRFLFLDLPVGETLGVEATYENLAPAFKEPFTVVAGERQNLGEIVMQSGFTLVGVVREPSGHTLYGATVRLSDLNGMPAVGATTPRDVVVTTDTAGRYEIPHLALRQYRLEVSQPGFGGVEKILSFVLQIPTDTWTQDFVLQPAESFLGGEVLDELERPVSDAQVSIRRRRLSTQTVLERTQDTGADGRFRFEPLPDGKRYDVEVDAPGYYLASRDKLEAGRDDHRVHLLPALTVRGKLIARSALPEVVQVTVLPDVSTNAGLVSPAPARRTFPQAEYPESFVFDDLRPGTYAFEVRAEGFAVTRSPSVTIAATTPFVELQVLLFSGGDVTGRLMDGEDGVAQARVELRDEHYDPSLSLESAFPTQPLYGLATRTDEGGRFALERVPQGKYTLSLFAQGSPPIHVRDLIVEEGAAVELGTLVVEQGAILRGRVLGEDGEAQAGARVSVSSAAHHGQATTDATGRFVLEGLPAGDYDVAAIPKDLWAALRSEARQAVSLRPGDEFELELTLALRELPGSPDQPR